MSLRLVRRLLVVAILGGLGCLVAGAGAIAVTGAKVVVPKVAHEDFQTAYDQLHAAGLRVSVPGGVNLDGCCNATLYVTHMSPAPGRHVAKNSVVTLAIGCPQCGAGSPAVPISLPKYRVPDFAGRRVSEAFAWARAKRLYFSVHLGRLTAGNARDLYDNYRVSQQEPAPGKVLTLGRGKRSNGGTSGSFLPTPLTVWGTQTTRPSS